MSHQNHNGLPITGPHRRQTGEFDARIACGLVVAVLLIIIGVAASL